MPRLYPSVLLLLFAACSGPSSGGPCTSNRDCIRGETCVGGQCISSSAEKMFECTSDDGCPSDQVCDLTDHVCKPANVAGETDSGVVNGGADATETGSDGGSISSDANDLIDAGGEPADSGVPPIVDAGRSCSIDTECNPPMEICINNACVFGCTLDSTLCTPGQVCNTNTGRCVTVPTSCTVDSQCAPPMTVCESTQCVPGCGQPAGIQCTGQTSVCNSSTGRCEAPPPPPPCNLDADCGDPLLICVNMVCSPRCDSPSGGCPGTDVCNTADGRCLPGQIGLGGNCTIDVQCTTNLCLGLSVGTTNYTVCSDPCSAASNCPLDFACTNVSGMNFCLGEAIFGNPPATFDTSAGGFCSTTVNTCQSGWCNTGLNVCLETCSKESDCTNFGGNCHTYQYTSGTSTLFDHFCYVPGSGGNTGASCTANSGCRSGICNRYTGLCAQHCCSDGNCGSSETCLVYDVDATTPVKVCGARSAMAGTGALGASCTVAADCESELCAPVNPDDPASPMKCSTTCCTNSDCSQLPLGGRCRPFGGPIMNTLLGACIPN